MPKVSLLVYSLIIFLFTAEKSSAISYNSNNDSTTQAHTSVTDTNHSVQPTGTSFVLQPVIGASIGMLSYFGNVKYVKGYAQNPTTSRIGWTLNFAQKINQHVEFNLYGLFGTLGQYERSPSYNWNFESQIAGGGFNLTYKFYPQKDISPYVSLGLESFNFLSKTDMRDKYGNKYYYWSDGSIRSIPQNLPDASLATVLTPDYTYETDIRSLNLDGSGNYSQQTFAVPIGAGVMMHISRKADFSVGTTLHYTFTDHIDGLTPEIQGPLKGTTKHDMFLLTAVSFRYDLTSIRHLNGEDVDESRYDNAMLDASVIQDTVVPVVNNDTLPQTAAQMALQYKRFKDTTGAYEKMTYDSSGVKDGSLLQTPQYVVEIGKYSKAVPPKEMDKILSVADAKSNTQKDSSTIYTAGSYDDIQLAKIRKEELKQQGFKDARVVLKRGNEIIDIDKPAGAGEVAATTTTPDGTKTGSDKGATETGPVGGVVFRVQLGAFKHKLTGTHVFTSAKNLIEIKTENDYYTYSVGSFTNYKDAAALKAEMISKGYSDAFVKAYRNGKRITLAEAGAGNTKAVQENNKPASEVKESKGESAAPVEGSLDKKDIKFKVQLGAYKGNPPAAMRAKFKKFKNLAFDEDESGKVHYNIGPYNDYAAAKAMKEKVVAGGIKGAFVVAYYKDKPIPVKQAIEATKK